MGAVAAIIIRKERDIVDIYRGAGATSAGSARDPGELGIDRRLAFRRLVTRAVLRDAGGGRYYLDESRWTAFNAMRHRLAFVMLAVVLLMTIVLISAGVVRVGGGASGVVH
jgi:hypothetical protein